MPGGALDLIAAGGLDGVERDLRAALRPLAPTSGTVGLRDRRDHLGRRRLTVRLTGRGGHTSRPHLTEDLTYALGKVVTDVPAALSPPARPARRRDAWCGAWSGAGAAAERHPRPPARSAARCGCLDEEAWAQTRGRSSRDAGRTRSLAPYGVHAEVDLRPRRPAGRQRARPSARRAGGRGRVVRRARGGAAAPSRAWAARTSPGTCRRCPARWPGWAPARRAAASSTCTRATCGSTSAPSAVGPACWPQPRCVSSADVTSSSLPMHRLAINGSGHRIGEPGPPGLPEE